MRAVRVFLRRNRVSSGPSGWVKLSCAQSGGISNNAMAKDKLYIEHLPHRDVSLPPRWLMRPPRLDLIVASPFVKPNVTRHSAWVGWGKGLPVPLLTVAPCQAEPLMKNDRVLVVEAISRKTARTVFGFLLMSQSRQRQMVEAAVEVIGPKEVILRAGGEQERFRCAIQISPHHAFQKIKVLAGD